MGKTTTCRSNRGDRKDAIHSKFDASEVFEFCLDPSISGDSDGAAADRTLLAELPS
jgi:hypothetical protein